MTGCLDEDKFLEKVQYNINPKIKFNSNKIKLLFKHIVKNNIDVHSVIIVKNGYIVAEKYFKTYNKDYKHEIFSCTKSFISALVGIAIDEGYINNLDQKAIYFFPEYKGKLLYFDEHKKQLTIGQLLTMTSGIDWSEGYPYGMFTSPMDTTDTLSDWTKIILDKPVKNNNEEFYYESGNANLISAIIKKSTGISIEQYANKKLFEPLGINDFVWMTDPKGLHIGGYGLSMKSRDMAKFGLLYLNKGKWNNKQIVSEQWIKASTSPLISKEKTKKGMSYGFYWWIIDDLKYNIFAAYGDYSQCIMVIPKLNAVIVFTSGNRGIPIHDYLRDYIIDSLE
jgi:CubicO group peptidase (beta-lactamase class C family)